MIEMDSTDLRVDSMQLRSRGSYLDTQSVYFIHIQFL